MGRLLVGYSLAWFACFPALAADLPPLTHGLTPVANPYPAPALRLTDLDGKQHDLANLKGKLVVVNFWATWCPPCREELPLLVKVHKRYGKKVGFLGLAVEDNVEFVGEYAGAYGLRYPIAAGREPAIALMQALGNAQAGMPFTVVVDAEGQVVYAKRGMVTEKELAKALAPLLRP